MEIHSVESEKYVVRRINENDFEDVKALLKENEYLGRLWSVPLLSEGHLDDLIRNLYIKPENGYAVIDKRTEKFNGYMSIMQDDYEGELSVRMRENVDMYEVLELFGKVLKGIGPAGQKNLTIQYSFE